MAKEKKEYKVEYNLLTINIFGLVYTILFCILTFFLIFKGIGKFSLSSQNYELDILIPSCIALIPWFVLHEIIHGLFYVIGGAKKKNISYGASLEHGVFFCKCNNFITKKNAIISLQAPLVIIGILTYIISFFIGDYVLLLLSIYNICGACGDITILLFFLKLNKDTEFREYGDTTSFILRSNEDLTKKKYFGIKSIKEIEKDSIPIDIPKKKVEISKASIPVIIIYIIMIIICIIGTHLM